MKLLIHPLIFLFFANLLTIFPGFAQSQDYTIPNSGPGVINEKTETTKLFTQIDCATRLMDQLISESGSVDKSSEEYQAFTHDISLLKELITWMKAGNEAARFPGKGANQEIMLMSQVPSNPNRDDQSQVTYLGQEVLQLPGLTIKRLKK